MPPVVEVDADRGRPEVGSCHHGDGDIEMSGL